MQQNQAIKTLFLGSNWEALEVLKALVNDERFEMVGLITKPDAPVGRKKLIERTGISKYADSQGIEVFYTVGEKEKFDAALEKFQPELIVCLSFGEILPGSFIEWPKYKAINVHFSLLPKYRGAVPIQAAILNGDKITGISIAKMVEKLDAGPVLAKFDEEIREDDTNLSLRERLVAKSALELPEILMKWCLGEIKAESQDDSAATFCKMSDISKENAQLDFDKLTAIEVDRRVRAFIPWPVAWFMWEGKRVKLFKGKVVEVFGEFTKEDEIFKISEDHVYIECAKNTFYEIYELQVEGKNRVGAKSFARQIK